MRHLWLWAWLLAPAGLAQPVELVESLEHTYGPFELRAGVLQQMPPIMEIVLPEDLWLVGYRTEMVDPSGARLSREFQCHTFFGTTMPQHHTNDDVVGLFSDGYTEAIVLPPGFGISFKAGEKIIWNPMFNNRNSDARAAGIKLRLDVIRSRNLKQPLRSLRTTFRTIRDTGDLYFVPPGKSSRETTFRLPFSGTIHVIGTHIHPHGVSIELVNVTRNETVWTATGSRDAAGRLLQMPVYMNREGYPVSKNELFKLRATYENPTHGNVDAMAGVFILYAPQS